MKLEELFNTLQSSNANLNNLLSSAPTSSQSSTTNSNSTNYSLHSPNSTPIIPSLSDFGLSPNSNLPTIPNNVSPASPLLSQLFSQMQLGTSSTGVKPNRLDSTSSNQSSHALLDGLMKSPDEGLSPQNGIFFDEPLVQRLLQSQHENYSNSRSYHDNNSQSKGNITSQLSANMEDNRISPGLIPSSLPTNNPTTPSATNIPPRIPSRQNSFNPPNGANNSSSNSNNSLNFRSFAPFPYNNHYNYQQSSSIPPSIPPYARPPGLYPPPPSAGFPGYPQQPFPPPFNVAGPRPSVAPFPPAQVPFPPASPFVAGLYRNASPYPPQPPPHLLPTWYTPQQLIAYQQYFAYYYNTLTNFNRANSINQAEASLAELASNSASSAVSESLSSGAEMPFKRPEISTTASPSKKAIRVDVNDLFSLSKAYSETSVNQDPNRILFDLIQKRQEMEQTSINRDRNGTLTSGGDTDTKFADDNDKKKRKRSNKKKKDGDNSEDGIAEVNQFDKLKANILKDSSQNGGLFDHSLLYQPSTSKQSALPQQKIMFDKQPIAQNMKILSRPHTAPGSGVLGDDKKKAKQPLLDKDKKKSTMNNVNKTKPVTATQKAPKELANLNENYCLELLKQLRKELLVSKEPISAMIQTYDWKKSNYMYTIIKQYFYHLEERIKTDGVTYLNLIDSSQYSYDDFASFGARFWDYINESMLFPLETITQYSLIIRNYEELFPKEIIELRNKLLAIKLEMSIRLRQQPSPTKPQSKSEEVQSKSDETKSTSSESFDDQKNEKNRDTKVVQEAEIVPANCPVNYKMVTFRQIDSKRLHMSICQKKSIREQINHFISQVCLSVEGEQYRDQFLECLNDILRNSQLAEFGPTLHKFGSLSNGLGTYDSDLDIVIKFENISVDILDYSTSMLALEVIELILQDKLGIRSKDTIVPSKRCPIIKLNFSVCFPFFKDIIRKEMKNNPNTEPIEFNKCDISLITVYGVYNSKMLNFLTHYDRRFYEITLILKYWAKRNELIDTTAFSTYGFTMMIIFFLQSTNPPVLPPISKLQRLGKKQPGKEPIKVHKYSFEFCDDIEMIGKSTNCQTIQELIVDFFRYYVKFDFYNYAISPRLGKTVRKNKLRQEKVSMQYDNFNMASYICIEDPFVLEHNVGYIFRQRNIYRWNNLMRTVLYKMTNNNCIKVLVDPGNFTFMKAGLNLIYLPFNLFCYQVRLSDFPKDIKLELVNSNQVADICNSITTMNHFYYIVVRHLLESYLAFPHHDSAYILELTPDGLDCSIDFAYLSHINFKLDLRNNHQYDSLFQNARKRASDCTKRFTLLKMLRRDLRRAPVNPKNPSLRDRKVKTSGVMDKWFRLELARNPPVHPSQTAHASYQALLQAKALPVPYFVFRILVQPTPSGDNPKLPTGTRFGELVQEVLQQFNFAIDRANPMMAFNSQVEEFFSD